MTPDHAAAVVSYVETLRGWLSTGFLGALLYVALTFARPYLEYLNKRNAQRLEEKAEDRQGYGDLIKTLNEQVKVQAREIEVLKFGRDRDHRLILALLGQLNRAQIGALLHDVGEDAVSPQLREMFSRYVAAEPPMLEEPPVAPEA